MATLRLPDGEVFSAPFDPDGKLEHGSITDKYGHQKPMSGSELAREHPEMKDQLNKTIREEWQRRQQHGDIGQPQHLAEADIPSSGLSKLPAVNKGPVRGA